MYEYPLLVGYLIFGIFSAIYQLKKHENIYQTKRSYWTVRFFLSIIGWPVFIFWGWISNLQMLEEIKHLDIERYKEEKRLNRIIYIVNRFVDKNFSDSDLTKTEQKQVKESVADISKGYLTGYYQFQAIKNRLVLLWTHDIHPELYGEYLFINKRLKARPKELFYSLRKKSSSRADDDFKWVAGMTDEFVRSLRHIDKNKQETLLKAIKTICKTPLKVADNVMAPVSSATEGLWRCRTDDGSIIYLPVAKNNCVILLCCSGNEEKVESLPPPSPVQEEDPQSP